MLCRENGTPLSPSGLTEANFTIVLASRSMTRAFPFFGSMTRNPLRPATTACRTGSRMPSKSTSFHRTPSTSPRRIPVNAATCQAASSPAGRVPSGSRGHNATPGHASASFPNFAAWRPGEGQLLGNYGPETERYTTPRCDTGRYETPVIISQNGTSGTSWHHAARFSLDWGSRGRWFKSSQPDEKNRCPHSGFSHGCCVGSDGMATICQL